AARLTPLCTALKAWDGRADLNSGIGFVYFQRIVTSMQAVALRWRVEFDPRDPVHTPSGLAIENPQVATALRAAMLAAVDEVTKAGLSAGSKWGDIQVSSISGKQIPIHGGPAGLGVYNAMQTIAGKDGKREVVSGTSYLQVVSFDEHGPKAQGLLAFSESSNPQSAHSSDQTEAFSKKQWQALPFTEQQIKADPAYEVQVISEEANR
ncbi:peptidase S45, penicillin amidase, partial [Pseudomonas syringae pv. pisi str. 1704B]